MSILGSALIGGAVNLGVSAFNSHLSEKAAQKQFNRQLDFWQQQNEYNSPSNQRKRLSDAGFNPHAVVGDVAGNNVAGGLSSVPRNEVMSNGMIDVNSLNNSLSVLQQMEQVGANTDLLKRQVELSFIEQMIKQSSLFGIELDNKEKQELLKWLSSEKEVSLQRAIAEIDNIKSRTDYNNVLSDDVIATRNARIDQMISNSNYNDALSESESLLRDLRAGLINAQSNESKSRASNLYIDSLLKKAEIRYKDILSTNATNQESRNQALFVIEEDAKSLERDGIITENQLKRYQAELNGIRAKDNVDFDDFMKALRNSWLSILKFD